MNVKAILALLLSSALASAQVRPIKPIAPSQLIPVQAKAISILLGALVCPDLDSVRDLFDEYDQYFTENLQARLTGGQSTLVHGPPPPAPRPEIYGCVVVKPGTKMMLEKGNVVSIVRVTLPNGNKIRGVTQWNMYSESPEQMAKDQAELNEKIRKQEGPTPKPIVQTNAIARAMAPAPGAVVCGDTNGAQLAYQEYLDNSRRGFIGAPSALSMGCTLIPAGTRMAVSVVGSGEVRVDVAMPGGGEIHGVTLPQMVKMDPSDSTAP